MRKTDGTENGITLEQMGEAFLCSILVGALRRLEGLSTVEALERIGVQAKEIETPYGTFTIIKHPLLEDGQYAGIDGTKNN